MSFRCDFCQEAQAPRATPRVVTRTERVTYYHDHRDPTIGTKIVSQKKMCTACYQRTPEGAAERFADGKVYKNVLRFT
jgi:hypothetical protein